MAIFNSNGQIIDTVNEKAQVTNPIALAFDSTTSYNVGDYVSYNGSIYKCKTEIGSGGDGSWIAGHWDEVKVGDEIGDLKEDLSETNANLERAITLSFQGKKISIIGDSIDTFDEAGYKIDGYRTRYPDLGVENVEQTWWKQVINATGAILEINASWDGSRVTNTHPNQTYPDLYDRVSVVGNPDIILVALGTNDSNNSVQLGEYDFNSDYNSLSRSLFRQAYIKGIKALKDRHPNARIISVIEKMAFIYKDSIEHICSTLGIEWIDVSNYETVDGFHPGVIGMGQIARYILSPINNICDKYLDLDKRIYSSMPDDAKMLLLAILRNITWNNGNNNYLELLGNCIFDNTEITQIYPDELTHEVGWGVNYPYFHYEPTRLLFLSWDMRVTGGHAYTVRVESLNHESIAMYINAYNKNVYDKYQLKQSITQDDKIDLLKGWGEIDTHEYTVVVPNKINNSPTYGLIFGIKKNQNAVIDTSDIAFCTIKDVTGEISKNRDLTRGIIINGTELKKYGIFNTIYPYVWQGEQTRLAYVEFDLNVKPGSKYNIEAFAFQQKPICIAINAYNQNVVEARALKQNISRDNVYDLLGGWSSPDVLKHTVTIPQTINDSVSRGLLLLFKYNDGSIMENDAITYITIKEVSD